MNPFLVIAAAVASVLAIIFSAETPQSVMFVFVIIFGVLAIVAEYSWR